MATQPGKKVPDGQNITGLRMADLLSMPDEVQPLMSWMMRNGAFTLEEAVEGLKRDADKLEIILKDLAAQRLLKQVDVDGVIYYKLRLAHSSHRQMPQDIWKVLDQQTDAANVFISYSRRNKGFVRDLAKTLKKRGREVWVDWDSIPYGTDWWEEIKTGIELADTFLFVLSPDSVASKICGQELDHAILHNKRLVPVVCEEVDPTQVRPELGKINWIFLQSSDDFDRGFRNLLNVLDTDLPYVRTHTRLLMRAQEWNNRERDGSLLLRGSELEDSRRWLTQSDQKQPQSLHLQKEYIWASYNAELGGQNEELARQQRSAKLQRLWTMLLAGVGALAIAFGIGSFILYRKAEESSKSAQDLQKVAEIQRLTAQMEASAALFSSAQYFDALFNAVEAGVEFRRSNQQDPDLQRRVVTALQQSIFGIQEKNHLDGHKSGVLDVAFSPDGTWLASASADETVRIWRSDGALRGVLEHPGVQVWGVAIAPNSALITTAGDDGVVRLWEPNGTLKMTLSGHSGAVRRVSFAPDGQSFASAADDGTVRLWRLDGTLIRTLPGHRGAINDLQFSPNGRLIATAGSDRTVRVWQTDGTPMRNLPHFVPVNAVRFSPNSQRLYTGGDDGQIRVWNQNGLQVKTIAAHDAAIHSIAISPDGESIATAGWDQMISIWKTDGTLVRALPAQQSRIYRLQFSPDGKTLASAGGDRSIRLWALQPAFIHLLPAHGLGVNVIRASPDGQTLVTASPDNSAKLWRAEDNSLIRTLTLHRAPVTGAAFTPDGQNVVTVGGDRQMVFWTNAGAVVWTQKTQSPINAVAIRPDGERIATGNQDGTLQIWDRQGTLLQTFPGHSKPVLDLAYSPDGKTLASAGSDNIAILWNESGQKIQTLEGHYGLVLAIQFSPDGTQIATGSADNTAILWNLDGTQIATLNGHNDGVATVRYVPDGQMLMTGSFDGTIRSWTTQGLALTRIEAQGGRIHSLDYSPDGANLLSGGSDPVAIIWQMRDMNQLDHLLDLGCGWLQDYLSSNIHLESEDRALCRTAATSVLESGLTSAQDE